MIHGGCGLSPMLSTEITYYPTEEGKEPEATFPSASQVL